MLLSFCDKHHHATGSCAAPTKDTREDISNRFFSRLDFGSDNGGVTLYITLCKIPCMLVNTASVDGRHVRRDTSRNNNCQ